MADANRSPPPGVHRFVPTLTEVVQPEHPPPAPLPAAAPITKEMLEEIVDASIRRAEAALSQRLPELLAVVLHEHALAVSERLRREIKASVRESVTAALDEAARTGPLAGGVLRSPEEISLITAGNRE